jgi:hypothetical protein
MDKSTAENTRGQLAGSGVWVQVAEIFKMGQKIQNLHVSGKKNVASDKEQKRTGQSTAGGRARGDKKMRIV